MDSQTLIGIGAAILTILLQLWFWRLRTHEERSLWLGFTGILAAGSLLAFVTIAIPAMLQAEGFETYRNVGAVIDMVFLILLMIFPVALVITLIVSGIKLIRREGASFRNVLSLGLGLGMIAYLIIWSVVRNALSNVPVAGGVFDFIFGFIAVLFFIFGIAFTLYTVSAMIAQIPHYHRHYVAIIVHGAGLMPDGSPTPLLAKRVDKGIEQLHKHPEAMLILSGGQGADEVQSEASSMKTYALAQGVPENKILLENHSATTKENLQYSDAVWAQYRIDHPSKEHQETRFLVVSDNYHVFRALLLARELNIQADGVGSHVSLYFALNALVREWVAYMVLRKQFYNTFTIVLLVIYTMGALLILG